MRCRMPFRPAESKGFQVAGVPSDCRPKRKFVGERCVRTAATIRAERGAQFVSNRWLAFPFIAFDPLSNGSDRSFRQRKVP